MKLFLVRNDKAGDALRTLPTIRVVQSLFSEIEIHILASKHNYSIFESEKVAVHLDIPKSDSFDIAVSLLADPDESTEATLLAVSANKKFSCRLRSGRLPRAPIHPIELFPERRNETLNIASLVFQAMGKEVPEAMILEAPRKPTLLPSDLQEAEKALAVRSRLQLGICPFSGLPHRQLPYRRWELFLKAITRLQPDVQVVVFGQPKEKTHLPAFETFSPTSFRTLGAYLKKMDAVIAVDSGPLYLAQCLEVPTLGFLSGGDSARWFPNVSKPHLLLKRGLFDKHPSLLEMLWAYYRFQQSLKDASAKKFQPVRERDLTLQT